MPTPVSALLHAATLVTAGVFLLLRISPVLEFAPFTLTTLTFLGGLTAFLGGSLGLVANDMKKVIAYSTMSQLGYMIYAIGISAYSVSLYHLVNHAFFKALLFLSAGSVIHALSDEQDLRKMGGLRNILPFTYQMMFIGSISLMGIPYTSGFYSKEVILTLGYSSESLFAGIGYWLCSISALFTAIYSFRLITTGFLVNSNISKANLLKSSHEPGSAIIIVLTTLAITSLTVGYSLSSLFANNSDLFDDFIFNLPVNYKTSTYLGGALYPLFLTIFGGLLFYIIYMYYNHIVLYLKLTAPGKLIYNLLNSRYYFDIFYSQLTKSFIKISLYLSKELDKGLGEFLGPTGLYYGLHQNPKIDNLYGFKKPGSHFITEASPILYGGYIILSLLLTLISLAILSY
jgi:NADH-ubiquinone oxidoreductase chain 5